MNLVANPYLLGEKQVAVAVNLVLDEHGSLRTRDGATTVTVSPTAGQPIRYRGVLTRAAAEPIPLAIQRDTNPGPPARLDNRLWRTDTTPSWTSIGFLDGDEPSPDMVPMVDQVVILNGYTVPWVYDGTTLRRITASGQGQVVPTGARHGTFHLGALWLWNTAATTAGLDGPSSLRASGANNPDDWPSANQVFVARDDGQVGMGLTTFTIVETGISPTATLVLFKNYSTYQVIGLFGSQNFSVQRIKSDMGCIAPRTIQFVTGYGALRLSHKGFALYNGVEDRLVSEEVRPAIFGSPEYAPIDFALAETQAWATQAQDPPLYIAVCPVQGGGQRIFCYDLPRQAWTFLTLPFQVSSLNLFFTPAQTPVIHVGSASGAVLRWFADDANDVAGVVPWSMTTRAYFGVSPLEPTYFRRFQLLVSGPPRAQIEVQPIVEHVPRGTRTYLLPDAERPVVETTLVGDLNLVARHLRLRLSGTGPISLRGIEFHITPKPLRPIGVI